jgi:hypothetical protein
MGVQLDPLARTHDWQLLLLPFTHPTFHIL